MVNNVIEAHYCVVIAESKSLPIQQNGEFLFPQISLLLTACNSY